MFGLEFLQILKVLFVVGSFLVLGQVSVVFLLGCLGIPFIGFLFGLSQPLPVLADQFGNLCEGQILTLEVFSHLWQQHRRLVPGMIGPAKLRRVRSQNVRVQSVVEDGHSRGEQQRSGVASG